MATRLPTTQCTAIAEFTTILDSFISTPQALNKGSSSKPQSGRLQQSSGIFKVK